MFRPRVIPVLLLRNTGLVKTVKFKDARYIGDPINAVRIFNDKEADELVFLDIEATKQKRKINLSLLKLIGDEAFMPFAVGGGINSIADIKNIINTGAEKVVINSFAIENPEFIKKAAEEFGSSTIIVSIDIKRKLFGKYEVFTHSGTKGTGKDPLIVAEQMNTHGAGEILINSIDRDGMMTGYDIEIIKKVSSIVDIPVVACGGAGNYSHLQNAFYDSNVSAVSAGSMFVFHGPRKAVLISYPDKKELKELFNENIT